MGNMEKKRKENHATKVTKIPKIKKLKYGMNKTLVSILEVESLLPFCALNCISRVVKNAPILCHRTKAGNSALKFIHSIYEIKFNRGT